ncbi:MAG: lysophospholipase [Clostridia bacterium]|nr:lysophospholipase [Clostridia bacterium]
MNFDNNEYRFHSNTGITDIYVQSIVPSNKNEVKGIISIVHGMAEHTDRYKDIAEYLCKKGYAVFMHDHAGHGKSVKDNDDLGYFGENDGNEKIVDDVKNAVELAKKHYPDVPLIIWGHSMGSFVTRRFIAKYPDIADAAIICGTSGANPAAPLGISIAKLIAKLLGTRHRSKLLDTMAFGTYNKKFTGDTGFEWLSVNEENVKTYVEDKLCGYNFTAYGFKDLFSLLASISTNDWYNEVPKDLPIYLIAGDMDPVGNYGKGVTEVYNKLRSSGHTNVSIKLYKGLRHEIHNEKNRQTVLDDILKFADSVK